MIAYWLVTLLGLGMLGLSHAGRWLPAGDSFAVVRPLIVLSGLLWLGGGALAGLAHPLWLGLLVLSGASVLWPRLRPVPRVASGLTLYQKNLSYQMGDPAALLADIRAIDPDVITLQEVSTLNAAILEALSDRWPHCILCPHEPVGGVAVLSRHAPVARGAEVCATSCAGMRIAAPGGPVWVVSLHLPWPWPFGQALYLAGAVAALRRLEGPVLLAGDFNMVPWSHAVRALERATGSRRAGRARGTFPLGPVALSIDHVLAPGPAHTALRPPCGSDHRGLVARLA